MTDKKTQTLFTTSTILNMLGILVPFAYLTGYFYDQGYLLAYGFPPDAFPKTLEVYLVNFFIAVTSIVARILQLMNSGWDLFYFFVFITTVVFLTAAAGRLSIKHKQKIDTAKLKLRNFKNLDLTVFPVVLGAFSVLIPFTILSLMAFLILGLFSGYTVGQDVAQRELQGFSCKPSSRCMRLFKDGVQLAEGRVVDISDKFIGIYTEDGAQLVPNSGITFKNHPRSDE